MVIEKPLSSFRTAVIEVLSYIASLYFDSLTIHFLSFLHINSLLVLMVNTLSTIDSTKYELIVTLG